MHSGARSFNLTNEHYVRNSNRRHRSKTCANAIISDLKK
jgi:hypothetical protein